MKFIKAAFPSTSPRLNQNEDFIYVVSKAIRKIKMMSATGKSSEKKIEQNTICIRLVVVKCQHAFPVFSSFLSQVVFRTSIFVIEISLLHL